MEVFLHKIGGKEVPKPVRAELRRCTAAEAPAVYALQNEVRAAMPDPSQFVPDTLENITAYVRKDLCIGAYAAVMGGLDAIVFGGGIGLNSPLVRALSLEGLEFLGIRLDGFKNRMAIAGMDISMEDAPVRVFTVHTDEEIIVARKAAALLAER